MLGECRVAGDSTDIEVEGKGQCIRGVCRDNVHMGG